jgi:hypothetical protein
MSDEFLGVNVDAMHDGKANPFVVLELSRRDPFTRDERPSDSEPGQPAMPGRIARWRRLLRLAGPGASGEALAKGDRRHLDPRGGS